MRSKSRIGREGRKRFEPGNLRSDPLMAGFKKEIFKLPGSLLEQRSFLRTNQIFELISIDTMSIFRTVEISEARLEKDSLRFITVKSPHLGGRGDLCVFVPEGVVAGDHTPIALLLHGVYGSCWSWAWSGGVHLRARDLIKQGVLPPMILVMPSDGLWGDGSGYLPHSGRNFERWIVEDVPAAVRGYIPGAGEGSPLFITGLSMGGFGALRLGAKYHHLFRAVAAHSAITSLEQMQLFVEEDLSQYRQPDATDEDVLQTFLHNRANLPPIRFDCGAEDILVDHNRELHRQLEKEGIAHIYEEFPGKHEWPYWTRHIERSLLFFAAQL